MNDPRNLLFHRSNTFDLTITTVTLSNSNTESRITFPSFPNNNGNDNGFGSFPKDQAIHLGDPSSIFVIHNCGQPYAKYPS